jgi:hypothetical protein
MRASVGPVVVVAGAGRSIGHLDAPDGARGMRSSPDF